jgi:hypothetical protein
LLEEPATLTPWLKLEWNVLRSGQHKDVLGKVGLRWGARADG